MPDIRANLDEIERLRHALVDFAHRQADALEVANDEIRSVWRDLEEARDRWRYEVEIRNAMLQECHRAAMRAQDEGGGVDCSPYMYALQEAEHHLERVMNAQHQFEQAVEAYQAAHQRVAGSIDTDVTRAVSYLGAILSGLEDYRAAQLLTMPSTAPKWGAEDPPFPPQRPSPGPVTRVEFKEGNIGGREREG
jgi:hypothetical protein